MKYMQLFTLILYVSYSMVHLKRIVLTYTIV